MIISYLSISDRNEYIRITKYILQSNGIRFHIKSLVISLLSNVETPFNDEKQIALKLILQKKKYYDIFIDSLISKGWTNWLIQQGLLKNMYELKPTIRDRFFEKKTKYSQWILRCPFYNNYLPFETRKNQSLNMATFLLRRNLQSNIDDIFNLLLSLKFEEKNKSWVEFCISIKTGQIHWHTTYSFIVKIPWIHFHIIIYSKILSLQMWIL